MFKKLLVAIDGSELSDQALIAAIDLAKAQHSTLLILTATDPVVSAVGAGGFGTFDAASLISQLEHTYAQSAHALLAQAKAKTDAAGVSASTLYAPRQQAADAIIGTAQDEHCDTIVMGSHGRRGLGRLLLGSQAAEVLSRATTPVLVVK